jgi:ribosomal protein S18 acetylase RimI-like enzyme
MTVSMVSAAEVYPLRLLVLRPGGKHEDCIFSGDDDPDTLHLAAKDDQGRILGVASFYQAGHSEVPSKQCMQLRGMATHPDVRGLGYGKALVLEALRYFREKGQDAIWCNAREIAITFYTSLDFQILGEPFEIPGIGPHRVMWRRL